MASAFSIKRRTSTAQITSKSKSAGIGVVSNQLYVNLNGTAVLVPISAAGATTVNIGAAAGTGVTAVEYGDAFYHKTVLTLVNTPLTLADATVGAGVKIYDFPLGAITILGALGSINETTTSAILTTLNGGKTLSVGVGTVTQSNGTLVTTEQDILTAFSVTSSATINVAGATASKVRTAAPVSFDGTVTAIDAFLNVGVPTDTDIDADATILLNGTITIVWTFNS